MKTKIVFAAAAVAACVVGLAAAQQMRRPDARTARGRTDFPLPPPSPVLDALDADKDGVISAAEREKAVAALAKLDRNNDGDLTPDELQPSFAEGGPPDMRGMRRPGRGPGGVPPGWRGESAEGSPIPKNEAEKKILDVLTELNKKPAPGGMSVPMEDGRLLRLLTEAIGAKHVVEIGTSVGYSGIWFGLALKATGGKLTTFEIDAQRAAQARQNFKKAGVDGLITLVEGDAHKTVATVKDNIDLLFIDADKEGYLDYLEKLLPLVRPGGLIVAHNIKPGQGDPGYLKAITTDPKLETLFLHSEGAGVGVTLKKR